MTEQRFASLAWGLLLMAAGVLIVLHTRGHFDAWTLKPFWPLLLLVPAGQALVRERGCLSGWKAASLWGVAMVLLLLDQRGYPVFRPGAMIALALIAGGVYLIRRGPTSPAGRGAA
jgi:hypothetical protein